MRRFTIALSLAVFSFVALWAVPGQGDRTGYAMQKKSAEALYAEGSWALAHDEYLKIDQTSLSDEERRWVRFRVADTGWRKFSTDDVGDSTPIDDARRELDKLLAELDVEDQAQARLAAEIRESIGDSWWSLQRYGNWGAAWPHYQSALDWWSGDPDLDLARSRYLAIVWKAAVPSWRDPWERYRYWGNTLPQNILENAVKIAKSPSDVARANYLLALTMQNNRDPQTQEHVKESFLAAIAPGRQAEWHDDALFSQGQWLERSGRIDYLENGQFLVLPDFPAALTSYRRITSEYKKGETPYFDEAEQRIRDITQPSLTLAVSNVFLPGSKAQYVIGWRNVKSAEVSLKKVDLTSGLTFEDGDRDLSQWLQAIDGGSPVSTWTRQLDSKGDYVPGSEQVEIDRELAPGAYLLEAKSGAGSARELILVTDAAIVTRSSGRRSVAFVADARTGAPIANAKVRLWEQYWDGGRNRFSSWTKTTGADGIAEFELDARRGSHQLFATAIAGDKQAMLQGYAYGNSNPEGSWRIYAVTDRPAYRPEETVQWKATARIEKDLKYSTPANQTIEYEIFDPRGTKVTEGKMKLNAFGSAWSELALNATMPLGEYRANFYTERRERNIGSATLFRLEEYKLPEFLVTVKTPEENGKKKSFRLGDKVEIVVEAAYFFGGPVANASAEIVVRQKGFWHSWTPRRDYPWYFESSSPRHYGYGDEGQIVKREIVTTDADGIARVVIDSPRQGSDLEYAVEARVTDASRREVSGSGSVRVTQKPFYAYARPKHYLYRPGDKVAVDLETLTANSDPLSADGTIVVTRDTWKEVWLDPKGVRMEGRELEAARAKSGIFPPPQEPGMHPWTLIERGYEHEDVTKETLKTGPDGKATFNFAAAREGYYRVRWTSNPTTKPVRPSDVVSAETTVWVSTTSSARIGYFHDGVQLILDTEAIRAGKTAPIMVVTPSAGRFVLFSVEGEDIYSRRLVEMTGNVKLIELPIGPEHIPNIFIAATSVMDLQLQMDTKELIVPPVERFLNVDVKSDREQYKPREEGTFSISTTDADGKPVAAEVTLGLVDESVYSIQEDYAGDPRPFFYGSKRPHSIQASSSFQQRAYIKLVKGKSGRLIDAKFAMNERDEQVGAEGGVLGGVAGGYLADSVQEAISVTAAAPAMMNAPAPAPQSRQMAKSVARKDAPGEKKENAVTDGGDAAVQVRSDFRSTILWKPDLVTDASGKATVKVTYPDSLTTWRATARAATDGAEFGIGTQKSRTKMPLIVRLQAPRFFVVGDETVVSAVINNNTDKALTVTPSLDASGVVVSGLWKDGKPVKGDAGPIEIAPNGEGRVDWVVAVKEPGEARLRVTGKAGELADAMEKPLPVFDHGIEKFLSTSGRLRGAEGVFALNLPKERRDGTTTMTVQVAPSLAVTMLDALPYLIDYPYGCTEQTMSRFLPAAIVAKTLADQGIDRATVASRIFGGIERASAAKTHPDGKKDLAKLDEMIRAGLVRLYDFQHSDGGWGWWKEGESDHFMTAYVAWGLAVARDGGFKVKDGVLERAVNYLDGELVEEERDLDRQAWMLHALAMASKGQPTEFQKKALDNLWAGRDKMSTYGRAGLTIAAHRFGQAERAQTLVRNLENGAIVDKAPDASVLVPGSGSGAPEVMATAYWGSRGFWWRWHEGPVESTAFVLRALVAVDPKHRMVEPAMNWLVKNRRGAQWSNTRDTAITVLALNDFLRASGETASDVEYELLVNGQSIAKKKVTKGEMLGAPSRFAIPSSAIREKNEIRVKRLSGTSALYVSVESFFFSLEEPVKAAGSELFVKREYFKLVGRPTLLKGRVYDRVALRDGESVKSGERVEVVVTVETKNDYEYLLLEDLKPAGLEAVELTSGEPLWARQLLTPEIEKRHGTAEKRAAPKRQTSGYGSQQWVYRELRDRKVALFIDRLAQGVWEIRYTMRAEVPGQFHALPLLGQAMYVPEIRANGDETRITVEERE
ncbi:MAG: MG2 domain-containing protein [Thermoanaerobaculia bacterium]|nr:MG2 domain-containing protein [Thermoanaerobaculia bacterium]